MVCGAGVRGQQAVIYHSQSYRALQLQRARPVAEEEV